MVSSSSPVIAFISTVVNNPNEYGLHIQSNDVSFTSDQNELNELALSDEDEDFWCPDADTVAEAPDDSGRSGATSVFIWTRGDLARNETPLLNIFDWITSNDSIPYAIVRQHNMGPDYEGYYSLELHLEDGSAEAEYVETLL